MRLLCRVALAFLLSLGLAALLQQGMTLALGEDPTVNGFLILAGIVASITIVFAAMAARNGAPQALRLTAALTLATMLAFALAAVGLGLALRQPGFAGHIPYLLALYVDLQILLPAATTVPVHWMILRRATAK